MNPRPTNPRIPRVVEHIESIRGALDKGRRAAEEILFMLELEQHALGTIQTFIETGVDQHENCARCKDPRFCHSESECSGEPHSSNNCDCSLEKFEPETPYVDPAHLLEQISDAYGAVERAKEKQNSIPFTGNFYNPHDGEVSRAEAGLATAVRNAVAIFNKQKSANETSKP